MRSRTVARATIVGVIILMALTFTIRRSWGTEAPGCGDQHYRPRLAQCCPKLFAGEDLPPKCTHALLDGFIPRCCQPPQPTPMVTATPIPTYTTTLSTPTSTPGECVEPTPWPTPESHLKGECCDEVSRTYRVLRRAIVKQKAAELRALTVWARAQRAECREEY